MRAIWNPAACLVVAALAAAVGAAPPDAPPPRAVAPALTGDAAGKYSVEWNATSPAGYGVAWTVYPRPDGLKLRVIKGEKAAVIAGPPGDYLVTAFFFRGEDTTQIERKFTLTGDAGPRPPPPGPAPDPTPVDPPPGPVDPLTSFRVVLVHESSDHLGTAGLFGKQLEDWLTANCTGGKKGWRRRDPNSPGELDPAMAELWKAVQPKITVTPCAVVERNNKVTIINAEPTPAKMVETLGRYKRGGQ